jgi:CarD family transcriptional regulator, regulator of rRNA transcription
MDLPAPPPGPGRNAPQFEAGDVVVHPYHGAGRVLSRRRRRLAGRERSYLEIELADCALKVMIPCESAAAVGLRTVAGPEQLDRIPTVLTSPARAVSGNWATRERHYRERLKRADVLELAAIVRDLASGTAEIKRSAREDELHEHVRRLLTSELAYALGVDTEQATAYIDKHLASVPNAHAHKPSPVAQSPPQTAEAPSPHQLEPVRPPPADADRSA